MTADEIKALLGLEPNPSCGFTTPIYEGEHGFAQYFLVAPERKMVMHRLRREDQIYHHYAGDPLELLLLFEDGSSRLVTVGSDLERGQRPQHLVPAGTFHVSRVQPGGAWALMATTVFPAVDPADVEVGDLEALAARYPEFAEQIRAF